MNHRRPHGTFLGLSPPLSPRGVQSQLKMLRTLRRIGTPHLNQLPTPFLPKRFHGNEVTSGT